MNQIDNLRFKLAVTLFQKRGDARALQVETLRFLQARTDEAYDRGVALLKAGKLPIHVSRELTLGNYIDQQVRADVRRHYNRFGIDSAGKGPIRVNRREYVSSESEQTYGRPDVRVGQVALDVTLSPKNTKTPQVVRFFKADFRPTQVVIIRPSRLGLNHTFAIQAPEIVR